MSAKIIPFPKGFKSPERMPKKWSIKIEYNQETDEVIFEVSNKKFETNPMLAEMAASQLMRIGIVMGGINEAYKTIQDFAEHEGE